jgi:predicted transcriptional regulator
MASTTTIRIDAKLKARLSAMARRAGTTPHAIILSAIEETVEQAESMEEMHRIADERWSAFLKDGKTVSWDSVKTYVRALGRGERPPKPRARKLIRK